MDEPRFDPLDYVSVFNRRKWWFIVPVTLALLIGGLLVWQLPRTYQASTTIAVSAARVSNNVIGAVDIDRQERMRAVSQQLLSRTVLERTARLEHLDQDTSIDAAVNRLRGGISVSLPDSITPGGGGGSPSTQLSPEQKAQLDSYQVRFVDSSPEDAQRIVNRLAQVFVEENSRSREIRATGHVTVHRGAAARQRDSPERPRRAAAHHEGSVHGPAAGTDQLESGDGIHRAASTRVGDDVDPRRAGSAVDDRASDREHAAGRRRGGRRHPRDAGGNVAVPGADAAPRARRRPALLHRQAPGDRAAEGRNRDRRKGRRRRAGAAGLRPDGDPQRQPGIPAAAQGPRDDDDAHRRGAAPAGGHHHADRALPGPRRSGAPGRAATRLAATRVRPSSAMPMAT